MAQCATGASCERQAKAIRASKGRLSGVARGARRALDHRNADGWRTLVRCQRSAGFPYHLDSALAPQSASAAHTLYKPSQVSPMYPDTCVAHRPGCSVVIMAIRLAEPEPYRQGRTSVRRFGVQTQKRSYELCKCRVVGPRVTRRLEARETPRRSFQTRDA